MKCRRGSIIIEFALMAPLLLALSMTILEGAWQALTAATLDIGAREASRFGATGAAAPEWLPAPAPASREDAIRRIILFYGPYVLTQENLSITISSYAGPGALGTPQTAATGAGGAGEMVLYELSYDQPFLSPLPAMLLGRNAVEHRSRMIIRNEPFPTS